MTKQEQKARGMISNLTLPELLDEWELTNKMKVSVECAMVRGWLMDELESRNPKAFDEWLEDEAEDTELRYYMMK